ncbi:glycosyltransferase [hydrocarbon metagenome]|uniref:Glycosyltransferase n=1 Tax=hydrocarbon metagenome TaxID=938273 RepID=A0A0W8FLP7_9ZZZZ
MKIAVCAVQVPFVKGGAEYHFDNLYAELLKRGYDVEYIKIPFKWYPPEEIVNHALIWRLLDLSESNGMKIDGVIAQKFPSYLVRHPNKVVWLLHQHRTAYDLAHTEMDDLLPYGKLGEVVRQKIYKMDNLGLNEARKIYTNSGNVAGRLWRYNKIAGEPLYHPPPLMGQYRCESYDDYIFYPSRVDAIKRQDLAIKCLQHCNSNIRLKIAGTGPHLDYVRSLAKECGVDDRVDFLGFVSEKELLDLYANAATVVYVPLDEDMGYVTLEAFLSKKPVITCADSGGPLEFVEDSVNGFIAAPSPESIAEKVQQLFENGLCEKMGQNGYRKVSSMNLSWDNVIKKLLEPMQ